MIPRGFIGLCLAAAALSGCSRQDAPAAAGRSAPAPPSPPPAVAPQPSAPPPAVAAAPLPSPIVVTARPAALAESPANAAPALEPSAVVPVVAPGTPPARISAADRRRPTFDPAEDDPRRVALRRAQTAPAAEKQVRLKAPRSRPSE